MFDLSTLQYNTENPTFITILLTVTCAFILSSLIAFTYEKTSRNVGTPTHYIQALILSSIVVAMVMQAIGDSLARGLGMLGALAMIRFRTTIRNPRNMIFMFSSIAAGIACGVSGFVIAFTGTITFCLVAFLLRITPFSQANNLIGKLYFELPNGEAIAEVRPVLKKHCRNQLLKSYSIVTSGKKEGRIQYEYHIVLQDVEKGTSLLTDLQLVEKIKGVKLDFEDMNSII